MSAMLNSEDAAVVTSEPLTQKTRGIIHATKIYFILCQATGRVKCGIAADPRARLAGLQVGSPTALKLIAEIDGSDSKERSVHRRLARWHIHGEWFQYVPEVCDIIVDEISCHLKDLYHGDCLVRPISPVPSLVHGRQADQRLSRFLADYTVRSPGDRIQSSKLYGAFDAWCRSSDVSPITAKAFTMLMTAAGYRRIHSNVTFFLDISLKPVVSEH